MTAPNNEHFSVSPEEFRRFANAFKNAGISVSDDSVARIAGAIAQYYPNVPDNIIALIADVYKTVSDTLIVKISSLKEFAAPLRRIKEETSGQLEIHQKRDSQVNVDQSRRTRRLYEIWLKNAVQKLALQKSPSAARLAALRRRYTPYMPYMPPSQFWRTIERRRKSVATSKIKKTQYSSKRRASVNSRRRGR